MTINCPECGRELQMDASLRGHMLGCPYCQARFAAPVGEYKPETREMTSTERMCEFGKRMGLSLGEMLDRTGKELVYIRHPENNKWVWCWVISEKDGNLISGEYYKRNRGFVDFILDGPQKKFEWFVWWLLLPLVPLAMILEGGRKVASAIDRAATREAYADMCYGGGGDSIFDHVNSVRKADIEFLFGGLKGK